MNTVLDKGHDYVLLALDGDFHQTLRFVKRMDHDGRNRYPGNTIQYPGTTMQSVIRCLLERLRYLQWQVWSIENAIVILALKLALWLFEFRAARRHGKFYFHSLKFAEHAPMCVCCGHTVCGKTL